MLVAWNLAASLVDEPLLLRCRASYSPKHSPLTTLGALKWGEVAVRVYSLDSLVRPSARSSVRASRRAEGSASSCPISQMRAAAKSSSVSTISQRRRRGRLSASSGCQRCRSGLHHRMSSSQTSQGWRAVLQGQGRAPGRGVGAHQTRQEARETPARVSAPQVGVGFGCWGVRGMPSVLGGLAGA